MHPGWTDTPGLEVAMPKFYARTKSILRDNDQGSDTIVWLAATRPAERGFWFDREIVTEYKMPFKKHSAEEEEKLLVTMKLLSA
jgi:dehydrogenase/reductase SDR family protein 12